MSEIVRRVILPRAITVLGKMWDPYSPAQTNHAVTLVASILPHLPSQADVKVSELVFLAPETKYLFCLSVCSLLFIVFSLRYSVLPRW